MPSKRLKIRRGNSATAALFEATDRIPVPRIGYFDYCEGHEAFSRRVLITALCKLGVKEESARHQARKQECNGTVRQRFNNALKSIGYQESK